MNGQHVQDERRGNGCLVFQGSLKVHECHEIKKALLRQLRNNSSITIELLNVTAVDLSFLQLVCSAHRYAESTNKRLRISEKKQNIFTTEAEEAGFAFLMDKLTKD